MSVRKVIAFDRDWMSKVEPGVPFSLVNGEVKKGDVPITPKPRPKRKSDSFQRSLAQMGELLTIRECAKLMKTTERFVYDLIYAGKLRKTKVGRHIRIASCDLEAYLCA